MPIKTVIAGGVSILGVLAMTAGTAYANGCYAGQNCNLAPVVVDPYTPQYDAVTIRNTEPLGHLRSVKFQRSPNVSITRVHGLAQNVALNDAPSGFTNGCNPSSTVYCRAGSGAAAPVAVRPAPLVSAPVFAAPVLAAPVQQPLRTWIGGGYDPSKFAPRQYGENTFTPGIAHIPTSIVDRSPERADQVLNSGRTAPQQFVRGGVAPRPETYHVLQNAGPNAQLVQGPLLTGPVLSGPVFAQGLPALRPTGPAPVLAQPALNIPVHSVGYAQNFAQPTAPVVANNGTFASNVGADGTYWEKTSGLTQFGDTVATQVICKRRLPSQTVHPVIGVPTPVCNVPGHAPHAAHSNFHNGQQVAPNAVGYGTPAANNPWTY
ncbi:MAG: hypothetical protein ABJG88_05710 [Litorimonas sp.]